MNHRILLTAIALLTAHSHARADDVVDSAAAKPWLWGISGGITAWENLGNIETRSGGNFADLGFGLDLSLHKRVKKWGSTDLLLGVDLGFLTNDSDIRGIYTNLSQRGLYLTPSVKLGFGERARYFLEAGAGWYNVDFSEINCYDVYLYCTDVNVPFDANALGTYLGFRAPLGRVAFLGIRAHHADFGQISGIDSPATRLEGPFYSLFVGAAF